MKKIIHLVLMGMLLMMVNGCSCKKDERIIEYKHYSNAGGETQEARILWEFANDTYTKYQIAYTSYVCSDVSVNYVNVIYLEITNKGTKDDAVIRNISFSTMTTPKGEEFNVGLWGDYKVAYGKEFYQGIENELLPKIKYAKYSTIKSIYDKGDEGYLDFEGINGDALTGGTVSSNNIVSIVKAAFDYHIEHYY